MSLREVLPDGTVVYRYPSGDVQRYAPVAVDRRRTGRTTEPAVELLPVALRRLPETRPDEDAFDHKYGCRCRVCVRPAALWYKQQKRLRSASDRPRAPAQPRRG